ncbi:hypothetical protein CBR_g23900 [Chara braunii]|uniref:Uncharacterized protein n=1 Tax=Chara braunii TaxID=69332 RepID=A0A388L568_CHABU|nr:hypothetical protein CBR_g23900 [Chara braunii]|eukprot:GBG77451.1 hypothetical protein CBR_g23900 [Chara braunii]
MVAVREGGEASIAKLGSPSPSDGGVAEILQGEGSWEGEEDEGNVMKGVPGVGEELWTVEVCRKATVLPRRSLHDDKMERHAVADGRSSICGAMCSVHKSSYSDMCTRADLRIIIGTTRVLSAAHDLGGSVILVVMMGKMAWPVKRQTWSVTFITAVSLLLSFFLLTPSLRWPVFNGGASWQQPIDRDGTSRGNRFILAFDDDGADLDHYSIMQILNRLETQMAQLRSVLDEDTSSLRRVLRRLEAMEVGNTTVKGRSSLKVSRESLRQAVTSNADHLRVLLNVSERIVCVLEAKAESGQSGDRGTTMGWRAADAQDEDSSTQLKRQAFDQPDQSSPDTGGHTAATDSTPDGPVAGSGGVDEGGGSQPVASSPELRRVPISDRLCNCSADHLPRTADDLEGRPNRDNHSENDGQAALVRRVAKIWQSAYSTCGNCNATEEEKGGDTKEEWQSVEGKQEEEEEDHSSTEQNEEDRKLEEFLLKFKPPPHLQDCATATKDFLEADRRKPNGSLPDWALDDAPNSFLEQPGGFPDASGSSSTHGPFPPWINGADGDNLPSTRIVQRDIWVQQHPVNCSSPDVRFAVAEWWGVGWHGIGSQLHGMTALLASAVEAGRVLVPLNNYVRADQDNCKGDTRKRLDCYFFPPTSSECYTRAMALLAQAKEQEKKTKETSGASMPVSHVVRGANSSEVLALMADESLPVVLLLCDVANKVREVVPTRWGTPWERTMPSLIKNGELFRHWNDRISWWRAQAVRYLLRQPSEYFCQVINHVRNQAFGELVAREMIASAQRLQNDSLYSIKVRDIAARPVDWRHVNISEDDERRACRTGLLAARRRSFAKLYVPRPLVSIIVRSGVDKSREMRLFSLPAFMRIAEHIRQYDPDTKHVWLTSDVEVAIKQAPSFGSWQFYFTRQHRIGEDEEDWKLEMQQGAFWGKEDALPDFTVVEKSLVNLIISSECDYFVGSLGSNWGRLVNEMRMTNGRFFRKFIAVNYAMW